MPRVSGTIKPYMSMTTLNLSNRSEAIKSRKDFVSKDS